MMRRTLIAALILAASVAADLVAQQSADERAVLASLDRFFEGMTKRDTAMSRAVLFPGSVFYATFEGKTRVQPDTAYISSLSRGTDRLVERISKPTVLIHGDIAEVWTPYEFLINDKRSHCGVDSFTFVRTESGWRMVTAVYTIERTGCS